MSAYQVEDVTIDRVATACHKVFGDMIIRDFGSLSKFCDRLVKLNAISVAARYSEAVEDYPPHRFEAVDESDVVLLKACKCWLYQSCESEAVCDFYEFSIVEEVAAELSWRFLGADSSDFDDNEQLSERINRHPAYQQAAGWG